MLSQVAVEALYSATYVENYLDSVENLPDDIQKYMTKLREIDARATGYYREATECFDAWKSNSESDAHSMGKKRAMTRLQQALIAAQELGDEKLQVSQQLNDLIELKTRQLDQDHKNLDYGKDELAEVQQQQKENRAQSPVLPLPISTSTAQPQYSAVPANPPSTVLTNNQSNSNTTNYASNGSNNGSSAERSSKRARRTRTDTGVGMEIDVLETPIKVETVSVVKSLSSVTSVSVVQASNIPAGGGNSSNSGQKKGTNSSSKKKKRKAGRQSNNNQSSATRDDTPPPEETIDPDEPTYCLCDQISFGEMILCDNDLCPIEWFHFSCVALMTKPKGKWFCPNCREKNKPTVMKAKAQFLKELERYNRDKEEKTSNASNPLA